MLDVKLGYKVAILLKSLFRTPISMFDAYKSRRNFGFDIATEDVFKRKSLKKYTFSKKNCYSEFLTIIWFSIQNTKYKIQILNTKYTGFLLFQWFLIFSSLFPPDTGRRLNIYMTLTSYVLSIYVQCTGGWSFRSCIDVI